MALVSLLGLDDADITARLLDNYRSTYVHYEGEPFKEPTPAASGDAAVDWIVPRIIRDESSAYNVENAQQRFVRLAIWVAFQPAAGDFGTRRDTIAADLADALGVDRNVNSQLFDGTFEYTGPAEKPPGLDTSHPWDWKAFFFTGAFYQQVA